MAISTIGTDALASAAVTSAKLASGAPSPSQLPAGTVLQVVVSTSTTNQSVSTSTAILTASITPTSASNKVLAIANLALSQQPGSNAYGSCELKRGSTVIDSNYGGQAGTTNSTRQMYILQGLDSPNAVTSQTYTLYIDKASGGTNSVTTDSRSYTITLMEIAV